MLGFAREREKEWGRERERERKDTILKNDIYHNWRLDWSITYYNNRLQCRLITMAVLQVSYLHNVDTENMISRVYTDKNFNVLNHFTKKYESNHIYMGINSIF